MKRVLAISIGPVQDFIAAARRTADLQAGSELLVMIAGAVARAVAKEGGLLVFPANAAKDGPNKIVAELPEWLDGAATADSARKAAVKTLHEEWGRCLAAAGRLVVRPETAADQVENLLEFYAAWADGADYKEARPKADRILAGRKALRDFKPPVSQTGVPKSSLDPARDCVVREIETEAAVRGGIRVRRGELLDAVSLLKRWRGQRASARSGAPVPSTSTLAALGTWAFLRSKCPEQAAKVDAIAEGLRSEGIGIGDLVLPGRLKEAVEEGFVDSETALSVSRNVREMMHGAGLGEILPYFAILAADGDRMGARISEIDGADEHRAFSRSLAEFAREARGIISRYDGHLVYSGGDDVLAFLPAPRTLDCAAALASTFESRTGQTLSAGIAVVHHLAPLQTSVQQARDAERRAKDRRNGFAIAVHTRGGEPRVGVGCWEAQGAPEAARPSAAEWTEWIATMRSGDLSRGFPYELRNLARELAGIEPALLGAGRGSVLRSEAARVLNRKRESGGRDEAALSVVERAAGRLELVDTPRHLEDLADVLIIARFLAGFPGEA